jgi:hypothetical protein
MRLLNTISLEFKEFWGDDTPKYIILSHRWGDDEPTYKSFADHQQRQSEGYHKVMDFCNTVRRLAIDVEWLWVDTCCIDKTNMVELSEAINSMYSWYCSAECCYAYLQDIPDHVTDVTGSIWFSRGWTLQELLAPATVLFFNQKWETVGYKSIREDPTYGSLRYLNKAIALATSIPEHCIKCLDPKKELNIKRNMTWMASRRTTRPEDLYYSMWGIFAVYMSPIYGEGAEHARSRLIREIWNEHGPKSRVDTGEFHMLSPDYQGMGEEVSVQGTPHKLPASIFSLEEPLTGTLYTVVKRYTNNFGRYKWYLKIYEDGVTALQVSAHPEAKDPRTSTFRKYYETTGKCKIRHLVENDECLMKTLQAESLVKSLFKNITPKIKDGVRLQ